jgi:hypothetical protein
MIDKATGKIIKEIALTDKDPGTKLTEVDNLISLMREESGRCSL